MQYVLNAMNRQFCLNYLSCRLLVNHKLSFSRKQ